MSTSTSTSTCRWWRRTARAARSATGSCSVSARPAPCAPAASWTASSAPCPLTPQVAGCPAPAVGSVAVVEAVWRRLGLNRWFAALGTQRGAEVLADATFAMVANRLVDPCSKRRLPEWVEGDVVMPAGFVSPAPQQYYRALDAVADSKEATEAELFTSLCDLANMDLTLVCYDLTSTYFEGDRRPSDRFPSKAFGFSRDHRSDRPQVVLGLLCTTDGLPIAHHVFAGNTADVSTLPTVLGDLAARLGSGGSVSSLTAA